jgi:hypothetical protein
VSLGDGARASDRDRSVPVRSTVSPGRSEFVGIAKIEKTIGAARIAFNALSRYRYVRDDSA